MAIVVILSLILTVYIGSTYYKDVSALSYWTPIPSNTPTPSPVPPTPTPQPTATASLTPEAVVIKNCTYSAMYWIYHPEAWPPQIVVGSLTYHKDEALAILQSPDQGPAARLFSQLHAAILNYLAGADFSAVRQTTLEASDWLTGHPAGAEISAADLEAGRALEQALEAYNTGLVGPGRCPDEPLVPLLTATDTSTPTETPTLAPTATNTPGPRSPAEPTKPPRRPRPQKATDTPRPPGDTPKPPTDTPRPTKPPPPTPVPTHSN